MSGGSLNYGYHRVEEMAGEIRERNRGALYDAVLAKAEIDRALREKLVRAAKEILEELA